MKFLSGAFPQHRDVATMPMHETDFQIGLPAANILDRDTKVVLVGVLLNVAPT
jgi:hypothetical protein